MKKTVSALALAGSLAFLGAAGAQADHDGNYPSSPVTGTVSDGTVAPGETFTFSGTGFNAGEPIQLEVSVDGAQPSAAGTAAGGGRSAAAPAGIIVPMETVISATTAADAAGNFSYPFDLDQDGVYTLTATGLQSGHEVSAQVVVHSEVAAVVPADGPRAGTAFAALANTGLNSAMMVWGAAGLGALVLGAGTVVAAKRRASLAA